MKTIGITGGTGFVGKHLSALLVNKGYEVVIFTTRVAKKAQQPHITYAHWNPNKATFDINALKEINAVVNLGGTGIADKRWTPARKTEIVDSRVKSTEFLLSQLKAYAPACQTLISASASGYYGVDREGVIPFTETTPPADDFLGDTCRQWETAAGKATEYWRTVILRFGIVLGKDSGAFPQLARPMDFGIMPILGSGKQVVSWIEVEDLTRLILFALENESIEGTFNAVAPNPVTHKLLMKTIAKEKGGIKIPAPAPVFMLRILLGEMSTEILKSCTVSAEKTLSTGFSFNYPDINSAVKAILAKA